MCPPNLCYRWRKSRPDAVDDFEGLDPSTPDHAGNPTIIGRFYKTRTLIGERWVWYMQWGGNHREMVNTTGLSESPRDAAREIEQNYDKLKQLYVDLREPIWR